MPYWFFSGAGRPVRRIVILVGRKYALFRLNTRLARFSDARLDRWTSRAGIERSELFTGRCQSNANQSPKHPKPRRSGRQLTPLSQSGRAVLLEDISASEMAVLIEVMVD